MNKFDISPISSDDEWDSKRPTNVRARELERISHLRRQANSGYGKTNMIHGGIPNSFGVRTPRPRPGYHVLPQTQHTRHFQEEVDDEEDEFITEFRHHEGSSHPSSEDASEGDTDEEDIYDYSPPFIRRGPPNLHVWPSKPSPTYSVIESPRPTERPIPKIWLPPGYVRKKSAIVSRGRTGSLVHPFETASVNARPVRSRSQDTFRSWMSPRPSLFRGVQEETFDSAEPSVTQRRDSWSVDITHQLQSLYQLLRSLEHLDMTNEIGPDWKTESFSRIRGNSSEVFLLKMNSGNSVAIKRLNITDFKRNGLRASKLIAEELGHWSKLSHPNVLPLQGFVVELIDEMLYPSLVTEIQGHGSLIQYSLNNQNFDKYHMVEGICAGLDFLHQNNIVHGKLKATNVVVSEKDSPLLTDFGITQLISNATSTSSEAPSNETMLRWLAPEQIVHYRTIKLAPTKPSDLWSFGMTCLELLTKDVPYANLRIDLNVYLAIYNGRLPDKPLGFDNWEGSDKALLEFCKQCWVKDPLGRPTASQLLRNVKRVRILQLLPYFNRTIYNY